MKLGLYFTMDKFLEFLLELLYLINFGSMIFFSAWVINDYTSRFSNPNRIRERIQELESKPVVSSNWHKDYYANETKELRNRLKKHNRIKALAIISIITFAIFTNLTSF